MYILYLAKCPNISAEYSQIMLNEQVTVNDVTWLTVETRVSLSSQVRRAASENMKMPITMFRATRTYRLLFQILRGTKCWFFGLCFNGACGVKMRP